MRIALGATAGMVWAVALLWFAARFVPLPVFTLVPTILVAFMAPGLVLAAMIMRLSLRRFFDDTIIDGAPPATGSRADIDRRVLTNTAEQLVLALCIWPAAAVMLGGAGPGVIMMLGFGFVIARLAFWIGYHISPPLRVFGFTATFYPTVLVAFWAMWSLATFGR